jgi:hypothetical protein
MARIQVLTLPSKTVGENTDYPFAIVIDELDESVVASFAGEVRSEHEPVDREAVKAATGAVGVILATTTLDVA